MGKVGLNVLFQKMQLESSDSSCSSESASDRRLAGRYSRGRLLFLFGIMTAFFFCFNGTNFGFFNFLTALAMRHPRLGLPKSAGARATTVYFASSAVARLVRFFSKKNVVIHTFISASTQVESDYQFCLYRYYERHKQLFLHSSNTTISSNNNNNKKSNNNRISQGGSINNSKRNDYNSIKIAAAAAET